MQYFNLEIHGTNPVSESTVMENIGPVSSTVRQSVCLSACNRHTRENQPSVLLFMLNQSPPISTWCGGNSAHVIFKLSFVESGICY
jgi:hypothetical protein